MKVNVKRFFGALLAAAVCIAGAGLLLHGCGGDNSAGSSGGGGGGGSGVVNNCGRDGTAGACGEVPIGGLTWMSQNLNLETEDSRCYGEGGSVYETTGGLRTLTPSEIQANCNKYGRLYTREAAALACQSVGWRLPTVEDWDALGEAVGGVLSVRYYPLNTFRDWENAGIPLAAKTGWECCVAGTDDYGFAALPGGVAISSEYAITYTQMGMTGRWWAGGDWDGMGGEVWSFVIVNETLTGGTTTYALTDWNSVRCVKD